MGKQFVRSITSSTFEVKKSKFISFILPYDQFESQMNELKEEHPKARHFVYAYRYINEFDQIVENQSDDGEPKGSSGRPTLSVMRGAEIVNSAIITVRYFGGIKLGVGGLVRAYGDSANLAINSSELVEYKKLTQLDIEVGYSNLAKCEHILKEFEISALVKDFGAESVTLSFSIAEDKLGAVRSALKDYLLS